VPGGSTRTATGRWFRCGWELASHRKTGSSSAAISLPGGLAAPRLVVADGAPGLISAVEEIWPRADRQHCAVHRLRNLLAKLPKSEQDRIRFNYWSALTDATSAKDGKLRLGVLISELEHRGYESAARCLSDDLDALVVHLRYPPRHRRRWRSTDENVKGVSSLRTSQLSARLVVGVVDPEQSAGFGALALPRSLSHLVT
jgi:Transposase, Mutator family